MLPVNVNTHGRDFGYIYTDPSAKPTRTDTRPFTALAENDPYMNFELEAQQVGRKRALSEVDGMDMNDGSAIRRRISRACDQCNQLRSKCNGRHPCAHCVESQLPCKYERVHKRRGRVPKKEQTYADREHSAPSCVNPTSNPDTNKMTRQNGFGTSANAPASDVVQRDVADNNSSYASQPQSGYYSGYETLSSAGLNAANTANPAMEMPTIYGHAQSNVLNYPLDTSAAFGTGNIDISGYGFPLGDDYSVAFMGRTPMVESPDWLAFTSPRFMGEQWATPLRPPDALRFPVLQVILPHLESIIP